MENIQQWRLDLKRNDNRGIWIGISIGVCLALGGCGSGRARPVADELYEVRLVDGSGIVQIVTTRWSDGSYRDWPIVQFRDGRGNAWVVTCPSGEPDHWEIIHIDEYQTPETLTVRKSMTLPGPWIYKLRFFPGEAKSQGSPSEPKRPHERF